jgi:hypothetical protein
VNINLGTLRSEIQQYLDRSGFAVFHSHVGGLEGLSAITWDSEAWPDYRVFLETAEKSGAKMILFASREFSDEDVEELSDALDGAALPREDRIEMEGRLKSARRHIGETCSLELSFSHGPNMYVYEVRPDWYDDFIDALEELETLFTGDATDASGDGLGGYYSNN